MNNIYSVWDKVEKRGDSECWPWTGYVSSGYGRLDISGVKGVYAHRAVYLTRNPGSIELKDDGSKEQCVLHRCDNPICCNPAHLFLGSHDENMKDKVAKDRQNKWPKSSVSPRAKLCDEDVRRIRESAFFGASRKDLRQIWNLSKQPIDFIINRHSYKDVA